MDYFVVKSLRRSSAISPTGGCAQVDGHREMPGGSRTQKIIVKAVPENGTHG
jgi:hypothetical protein